MKRPTDHPHIPEPPAPEAETTAREALERLVDAIETSLPPGRRTHHIGVALRVAHKALGRRP